MKVKKILLVDDEIQILKALSRVFFDTDYEVYIAESGKVALELLAENEVDLVITDMRMPYMDGYELLSEIKKLYPRIIRIILSGYAEESSIFKAILHNIAKFYILKPWNNEKLLEYVKQLFDTEDQLKSKEILLMINNLEKLPTIEASYQSILSMIENDDDIVDISFEIEKDFSISTKLLQVANSAYYGLQTGSVKHAAVYLGLQNLKNLIYSTSIISSMSTDCIPCRQNLDMLWEHALMTNKILHYLYEAFMRKKLPESASSAGLLHNVGCLVLSQNFNEEYESLISQAHSESVCLTEMERRSFQMTHQEVGGYLISWWELPFPIVESALFHHRPFDPSVLNKELVTAVHIAQHYAWLSLDRPLVNTFYEEAFDFLEVSKEEFEEAIDSNDWV